MAGGVTTWSQTAANNATSDTTVNWREGQAPSTVNNSARAMMTSIRKLYDDVSGNVLTGGSSTAYTISTNQSMTPLADGMFVAARLHTTNGATPTLNVDSTGAKAIRVSSGTAIPTGAAAGGSVHKFTYDSGDDCWYINNFFTSTSLALTGLLLNAGTAVATPAAADETVIYDDSAGANRKITLPNLLKIITNLTAETSPAIDDELAIYDTSASTADKITLQNMLKVVNLLTEVTSPNRSSDMLLMHSDSAATVRKIAPTNVGKLVRRAYVESSSFSTTTLIPADFTTPQITEGGEIFNIAFTPASTSHRIRITATANLSSTFGGSAYLSIALFDGNTAAIATSTGYQTVNNDTQALTLVYEASALSGTTTYSLRGGCSGAGTTGLTGLLGGTQPRAAMVIDEITP